MNNHFDTDFDTDFISPLHGSGIVFDEEELEGAKICVIGVGGGGGNAVHNMVKRGITGAHFVVVNTDQQALAANSAPVRIQAGRQRTKGLGAGARPNIGAEVVDENRQEIERALEGFDMVFITAGMGGGTGTGGAPVVAAIAKKMGILSVGIVTRPFKFEGGPRNRVARQGIAMLREHVDTLIVVPNDRLLDIFDSKATLVEAFAKADDVLYNATRGISDLITTTGIVNLDFADVVTTMQKGGTALMGAAAASGDHRAREAATAAINSPLLDGLSIKGARNVLVNITAGMSMGIHEINEAVSIIQEEAGDEVEVIFGTVIDDDMKDELRVTVIATGFDKAPEVQDKPAPEKQKPQLPRTRHVHREEPSAHYKGEDNLRKLDAPAYIRREPVEDEPDASKPGPRPVRRVSLTGEPATPKQDRPKQSSDDNIPTFLRKQMD
jgi:cell division protein FtsZ